MCIARFLADIVSPKATAITRRDRRQRAIFDYTVSFGVPLATMACHIIYQPNRFSIVRNVGCSPTSLMSWPTLLLRTIWPPVFAVIAVLYSSQFFHHSKANEELAELPFSDSLHHLSSRSPSPQLRPSRRRRSFGAHNDPFYTPRRPLLLVLGDRCTVDGLLHHWEHSVFGTVSGILLAICSLFGKPGFSQLRDLLTV